VESKPISVLLIEDNAGDARLIREVLKTEESIELELDHVTRLDRALEKLDQGGIDVAVVDLSLPDSQGIDTFKSLRARAPEVPIVILTGLRDQTVEGDILLAGGQEYLHKGALDLCVLPKLIVHAIERSRGRADATRAAEAAEALRRRLDDLVGSLGDVLSAHLVPAQDALGSLVDDAPSAQALRPALAEIRRQIVFATGLFKEALARAQPAPPDAPLHDPDQGNVCPSTHVGVTA
jgi:CheY-like chemotaxis protein